jgi:hypothetical protein
MPVVAGSDRLADRLLDRIAVRQCVEDQQDGLQGVGFGSIDHDPHARIELDHFDLHARPGWERRGDIHTLIAGLAHHAVVAQQWRAEGRRDALRSSSPCRPPSSADSRVGFRGCSRPTTQYDPYRAAGSACRRTCASRRWPPFPALRTPCLKSPRFSCGRPRASLNASVRAGRARSRCDGGTRPPLSSPAMEEWARASVSQSRWRRYHQPFGASAGRNRVDPRSPGPSAA